MNTLIITTESGPAIYHITYQLAFLLGFIILLIEGRKRKFPFTSILLVSTLSAVLLIVGTKVGTYRLEDWQQLFSHGVFPATRSKTIITGILFGMIGLLIGGKLLKLKYTLLDASAFVFPVVMILQRFGCLFAGCCFGLPTNMPWGIQYGSHYKISGYHLAAGISESTEGLSAPVHPVQLYMVLGYVLIIAVLLASRRRFRAHGSFGLFSLALAFSLRFIVEFFRDPVTNHAWGGAWGGLKIVQWVVLGVALTAGLIVLILEKRAAGKAIATSYTPQNSSIQRELLLALLLTAFLWLVYGWFTPMELAIFHVLILITLCSLVVSVFRRITTPALRWALVSLAGVSLVFMSQTVDIGLKSNPEKPGTKKQFKIGYMRGNLDLKFMEIDDNCNGHEIYLKTIGIVGGEYQQSKIKKKGVEKTFGIGMYGYRYDRYVSGRYDDEPFSLGMYGWWGRERPQFGMKLGAHLGWFNIIGSYDSSNQETSTPIFPILHFRFGRYNFVFCELGMGDDLPYGIAISRYRAGIGIGNELFNWKNDFRLVGGISQYTDESAFYIDSNIGLGKKAFISPCVLFGKHPFISVGLGMKF